MSVGLCFLQVNLSQCTNPIDLGSIDPLCPQDVFLNENPEEVYHKLLCCDGCAVPDNQKKDLLPVILAVVGTSVFIIILLLIILVLASKYRAARKYVREIQEGRVSFQCTLRSHDVDDVVRTVVFGYWSLVTGYCR